MWDFLSGKASKDIIQREIDAYNAERAREEELNSYISNELLERLYRYVSAHPNDPQLDELRQDAAQSVATLKNRIREYKRMKGKS